MHLRYVNLRGAVEQDHGGRKWSGVTDLDPAGPSAGTEQGGGALQREDTHICWVVLSKFTVSFHQLAYCHLFCYNSVPFSLYFKMIFFHYIPDFNRNE